MIKRPNKISRGQPKKLPIIDEIFESYPVSMNHEIMFVSKLDFLRQRIIDVVCLKQLWLILSKQQL